MIKTARSYYNKSRYIEKRTRKGGGIDHFQVGVGLLHVRKVEIMENLLFRRCPAPAVLTMIFQKSQVTLKVNKFTDNKCQAIVRKLLRF